MHFFHVSGKEHNQMGVRRTKKVGTLNRELKVVVVGWAKPFLSKLKEMFSLGEK